MKLTNQQAYVLANLNRVIPLQAKVCTVSMRLRYQIDGKECTAQIAGLAVKKLIAKRSNGGFQRLSATKTQDDRIGERQLAQASTIQAIRASLSIPETVRTLDAGKR